MFQITRDLDVLSFRSVELQSFRDPVLDSSQASESSTSELNMMIFWSGQQQIVDKVLESHISRVPGLQSLRALEL